MFIIFDILFKFTKRRSPRLLAIIAFVVVFAILGLASDTNGGRASLESPVWWLNPMAYFFFLKHNTMKAYCTFSEYMFATYITAEIWSIIVWVATLFLSYCTEKILGDRKED